MFLLAQNFRRSYTRTESSDSFWVWSSLAIREREGGRHDGKVGMTNRRRKKRRGQWEDEKSGWSLCSVPTTDKGQVERSRNERSNDANEHYILQVRSDLKRSCCSKKSDLSRFRPTEPFYIHLGQARCKGTPWGLVTRTLPWTKIAEPSPAGQSHHVIKEPLCILYAGGKLGLSVCGTVKVGVKKNPAVSENCTLYKNGERLSIV